jgi:acetyl esterase/lipase
VERTGELGVVPAPRGTGDRGPYRPSTAEPILIEVTRQVLLAGGPLLVGLMAGCSAAPPTVPSTLGTAHRNLTYCNAQELGLYVPRAAATHPLPIAMYVHGGGMTAGDKSDVNPAFLDTLASAGYAVASVNYRLAPDSRFPAQIEDVKCAIRYLRARATR